MSKSFFLRYFWDRRERQKGKMSNRKMPKEKTRKRRRRQCRIQKWRKGKCKKENVE
jgi:hypothetical protein